MNDFGHAALDPFLDWSELLERVGSDGDLLLELFDVFREEFPRMQEALQNALKSGDFTEIRRVAHSMKGMLLSLSFNRGGALASQIEEGAREGNYPAICEAEAAFGQESAHFLPAIEMFLAGVKQ